MSIAFDNDIFREATDFSDAYYVSGNLLLFAARSGGVTWFDTESQKIGQINGINSCGIKEIFVAKTGTSLVVYYDNTLTIAFYRLTCKDSGYIASEKWIVTLDSALPIGVAGMSIQDDRLFVVVKRRDAYFYILLDTATEKQYHLMIVHKRWAGIIISQRLIPLVHLGRSNRFVFYCKS